MKSTAPLQLGHYYHIYNRGNNREDLFREERNYPYFLKLYAHHVLPVADTFAYCLMRNHFHLLVRIKESVSQTSQVSETCEVCDGKPKVPKPSQSFSNLFNAYTKAINKAYGRTGSLFEERFGRIEVTSERYFVNLIFYIHFNPQKHGFVEDFREWQWSSYHALLTNGRTQLERDEVLGWFGSAANLASFHQGMVDERAIAPLIDQDLV
ncbi:MAG: transposase [Chloroflexi bacterium]|nr:transposase [Chloroflexota bacterium]